MKVPIRFKKLQLLVKKVKLLAPVIWNLIIFRQFSYFFNESPARSFSISMTLIGLENAFMFAFSSCDYKLLT